MQAGLVLAVEGSEPAGAAEARGSGLPTQAGATVILPLETLLGDFLPSAVGDMWKMSCG